MELVTDKYRVGNYIHPKASIDGFFTTITGGADNLFYLHQWRTSYLNEIEPILINNRLVSFFMENISKTEGAYTMFKSGNVVVEFLDNEVVNIYCEGKLNNHIKYVHQLQNFVSDLGLGVPKSPEQVWSEFEPETSSISAEDVMKIYATMRRYAEQFSSGVITRGGPQK
jgi:hypothetical protein